jgi:PAS domain S-box-containing protein
MKILVVEDNEITRKLLRVTLRAASYDMLEAADGGAALALAARERPDLVLQDLKLPDMDGVDLVRRLRELPGCTDLPVLAVSGFISRMEEARTVGGLFDEFLVKPVQPSELIRALEAHLPRSRAGAIGPGAGRRVLLADDEPVQLKALRAHLELDGFTVLTARDGIEALELIRSRGVDAVLSDVMMPRLDGFGLCLTIREDQALAHLPVVLFTRRYLDPEDETVARQLGANAFVALGSTLAGIGKVVLAALEGEAPRPATSDSGQLRERHVYRVVSQLERQSRINAGLAQRCAAQSAAMSVLSTLSTVLTKRFDTPLSADEMLAACLEAGSFSLAALYLLDPAGRLTLAGHRGYTEAPLGEVETLFGHEPLFRTALETAGPIAIPSAAVDTAVAAEFLSRTGPASALILPILFGDERLGILLVGTNLTDLSADEALDFARTIAHQIGLVIQLRRAFTRVAAAEQQYREIFEHTVEGILRTTPEGRLVLANPALARIFGFDSPAQMLAEVTDMGRQLYVDPEQGALLLRMLGELGSVSRFEAQMRRRDGRVIWVTHGGQIIRDADGETLYYDGVVEDITERKRTEAALRQSEKLAAMSTLVAGVAHELNNPLEVIFAHSEMLALDAPGQVPERAQKINRAAQRCARLVKNFLAMARQHPPERTRVSVSQVVRETAELISYPLRVNGITLTLDLAPELPSLSADPHQLQQVLLNLLTNAQHALRSAPAPRRITLTAHVEGPDHVRIVVADNGPGVPPEIRERIFEPFFTTKAVGEGTGLGLSLCQGLVESHGGTLTLDDAPGGGTRFAIVLPLALPAAMPPIAEAPADPTGRTILVVDDEPEVADVLGDMLRRDGHRVDVVPDGREALERVRTGVYEVILSDLRMPDIDGAELYRRLEAMGHPLTRRFVVITGDILGPETREFLERTRVPVLAKPLTFDELRAVLRGLLTGD